MHRELTRLLTVLAVVAIVTSSAFAPLGSTSPVGTAAAVHNCDTEDAAVFAFTFGYVNQDRCTNNHVDHAVEEVRDAETAQDKIDIYSAATGQAAQSNNYEALHDNYAQDIDARAWTLAETAVAEARENGSSKAEAKVAAREAIRNYIAVKQLNLIESYNTTLYGWEHLRTRSEQEGFQSGSNDYDNRPFVALDVHDNYAPDSPDADVDGSFTGITAKNVTLANGTTVRTSAVGWSYSYSGEGSKSGTIGVNDGAQQVQISTSTGPTPLTDYEKLIVRGEPQGPTGEETVVLANFTDYRERYQTLENKENTLTADSDAFVETIWTDLESGNMNTSDILSRTTLMTEYGTSAASNGTYTDVVGAAASMGLETPELANTSQMTVQVGATNSTYTGMLLARNAPNGSWNNQTTYNASNITGPVWIGTTDGEMQRLTGEFTITGIEDAEGNGRDSVATTRYNYQVSNTSDLQTKYDRFGNVTGRLQEISDAAGAGGGLLGSSDGTIVVIALLGVGAVLAYREQQGGNR